MDVQQRYPCPRPCSRRQDVHVQPPERYRAYHKSKRSSQTKGRHVGFGRNSQAPKTRASWETLLSSPPRLKVEIDYSRACRLDSRLVIKEPRERKEVIRERTPGA